MPRQQGRKRARPLARRPVRIAGRAIRQPTLLFNLWQAGHGVKSVSIDSERMKGGYICGTLRVIGASPPCVEPAPENGGLSRGCGTGSARSASQLRSRVCALQSSGRSRRANPSPWCSRWRRLAPTTTTVRAPPPSHACFAPGWGTRRNTHHACGLKLRARATHREV